MSDARDAILTLLATRTEGATICPSEAARALAGSDWRAAMPRVHAAVEALVARGAVSVTWRSKARTVGDGPYRIGRAG